MVYTAVMVPVTDFLTGVLSALVLYGLLKRYTEPSQPPVVEATFAQQTEEVAA
jgi:DNA-binding HxlR family transcriptional regulator